MTNRNLTIVLLVAALCGRLNAGPQSPSRNPAGAFQNIRVVESRVVSPGVTYSDLTIASGPWNAYVLQIDLTHSELDLTASRALDQFLGRELTSAMALRHETGDRTVVAALNADFFSLATGENENNCIIDTEFVKGTKMTESPYDTFDNIHSQFAFSLGRKPLLERFAFAGKAFIGQKTTIDLSGVNDAPKSNTVVLFNRYFGSTTPTDTVKMPIDEVILHPLNRHLDTIVAVVTGTSTSGSSALGSATLVLSGYNLPTQHGLTTANVGDTVKLWLGTSPNAGIPKTLVGGWPRIVLDGKNIGGMTDSIEGTFPTFSAQRNPRSGVGFSQDSSIVYFIAVDGRLASSVGMTLTEFADLMISQGVYQGLNLDGGGSTTFVLQGSVMNTPSDPTGERAVGNCLLLTAPKQATSVSRGQSLPMSFSLSQNYPNPFNPSTTIRYDLSEHRHVRMQVFNVLGQCVADLVNAEQDAGWNQVVWEAKVPSGMYFYRLEATSAGDPNSRFVDVRKMILLK